MVEAGTTIGLGGLYVKPGVEPTQLPSPPAPKLLGPFEPLVRFSGLDCHKLRKESIRSVKGILTGGVAVIILIISIIKIIVLMQIEDKSFSIGWAESTVYAFMAVQAFFSAISVMCWTREGFVSQFEDTLARLRTMRLSTSQSIDDYTTYHRKAAIMIIPIFVVSLSTSFYSSVTNRYMLNDSTTFYSDSVVHQLAPFIDFIGCIASALAVVIYVTVNTALNREIKHFNKELTNSARFQQLTLPQVLNNYSKRHSDLIQLTRFVNQQMSKYGSLVPLFTLISFVNAAYIVGSFKSVMDPAIYVLLNGWTIVCMGITVAGLSPPAKVQSNIQETAEILMHDDVLQTCGDDQMHHTYRVTLDRCLHSNSKMAFLNAFHVDSNCFNRIIFFVPNISAAMILYRLSHPNL
ncbi:Serpentine Receptor, class R [Caenorhabditis elegans]|nr:Serpentine Receptor, class R [Caenorhabditis elegans]CAB01450.2 Serpentine Receptor, class R [Caenorhabditis elegans]|eukprot:NP_506262.2 Serpentine Receptor, class R [Caenorhabditis elegans]